MDENDQHEEGVLEFLKSKTLEALRRRPSVYVGKHLPSYLCTLKQILRQSSLRMMIQHQHSFPVGFLAILNFNKFSSFKEMDTMTFGFVTFLHI